MAIIGLSPVFPRPPGRQYGTRLSPIFLDDVDALVLVNATNVAASLEA
jgi:hypothetical protein